jgi:hypothetical protein
MFTLRKLLLGEKTRLFMMVVIFIVFIVFSISIILEESDLALKFFTSWSWCFSYFSLCFLNYLSCYFKKEPSCLSLSVNQNKHIIGYKT